MHLRRFDCAEAAQFRAQIAPDTQRIVYDNASVRNADRRASDAHTRLAFFAFFIVDHKRRRMLDIFEQHTRPARDDDGRFVCLKLLAHDLRPALKQNADTVGGSARQQDPFTGQKMPRGSIKTSQHPRVIGRIAPMKQRDAF